MSEAELASAKNQLMAQVLGNRETVDGRADELANAIIVEGDAAKVNSDITDLATVTAADVQRVAQTWLRDDRRVTLVYRDETQRPAGQPDTLVQDPPQVAAVPLPPTGQIAGVETLPEAQRQAPPPPGPTVAPTPPRPVTWSVTALSAATAPAPAAT